MILLKPNFALKSFVAFILFLSLFSAFNFEASAAVKTTAKSATVTADNLNVREKPSSSSKKVGSLKKGTKVTVYSNTKQGWTEIQYNKKKAYVNSKYLKGIVATNTSVSWNGNYELMENFFEGAYGTQKDIKIFNQKGNKFKVEINTLVDTGASSKHGILETEATFSENRATVNHQSGQTTCKLELLKTNTGVKVVEKPGECEDFHGVYAEFSGIYKKVKK